MVKGEEYKEVSMKVLVAGGTGFVGAHLIRELRRKGHTVVILSHQRSRSSEEGIVIVRGDVTDPVSVGAAAWGCDTAINLVGIIREIPAKEVTFQNLHVLATRNMVNAAKEAGIRRYLQMSALGARKDAVSNYHQTKFAAEKYVRASGLDWTIFRPSLIFGPKDAFVNMLADQVRKFPVIPVIGDGSYRMQPIHADDVARCFVQSLGMPETVGQTYELCGPDRFTYLQMLATIGRALGKSSVTTVKSPLGLIKSVVPFLQKIPAFPLTSDQLQMLIEESICDGAWRKTFAFEPVRFEAGIREYLRKQ
jgi:NADH dehydrogenase